MGDIPHNKYRGRGIRLPRELYSVPYQLTAVTLGTHNRRPILKDEPFVQECIRELHYAAGRRGIEVPVYCFMPDHVHMLLTPTTETDIVEFIQRYKSWTTHQGWKHGIDGKVWQRSFYDFLLREHEDPLRQMRYIVENPVRAGLVEDWLDYPFTGSTVYDLADLDW